MAAGGNGDVTPREVAEELGVTVRTVQRWVATGSLQATRIGGRVRVSRSSLDAFRSTPGTAGTRDETPAPLIRSLLVANRGEVAARIARTARAMGIRVIGVHLEDEPPPRGADETHPVASYLDPQAMIDVARLAGANAIHPGYGFLAENADFAAAVRGAGLTWIGPPPEAITAMGEKAAARRQAAALGVPVVPGYDGDAQEDERLVREAERIGFPLLVKPSAGGGGKGMRVVAGAAALREALVGARREADRSFGDDRLILERLLNGSRHVEVQVLFDRYGTGVHLGERDCSTQRRNQKVVEEAPGPSVTPELRRRMSDAALRLAASIGYVGAGTVEMLLTDAGEFFFLEMNTRLQVEHPVTEAVTGRDIVADQIRVAGGETLDAIGLASPPELRGHAVEARLYAEDPEAGFLPATGRVLRAEWPAGVRVDSGIQEGDLVSDRFDPMLAKIVAHGATRPQALERLAAALRETRLVGVRTNLRFLRWLLEQPVLREGEMRTDTLERLTLPSPPQVTEAHWLAAAAALRNAQGGAWSDGWRLNAPSVLHIRHGIETRAVRLSPTTAAAQAVAVDAGVAHVDVDGQSLEFEVAPPPSVEVAASGAGVATPGAGARLVAPMPGRVAAVRAPEGARVKAHEPVIVLEAMKMEHAVVAPAEGRVVRVAVAEGQQVQRGDLLAEIEAG